MNDLERKKGGWDGVRSGNMRKEQQSQIVCQRCGRKLKDAKWTPVGYGRRCYKKFLHEEWERNQLTIFDFIDDPEEVGV